MPNNFPVLIAISALCSAFILYFYQARNISLGLRNNDSLFHLNCARHVRKSGFLLLNTPQFYPGKEIPYTYPPLLHFILSRFMAVVPETKLFLGGIFFEFINAFAVYGIAKLNGDSLAGGVFAAAIYLLIPVHLRQSAVLSPRPLGVLFFLLAWEVMFRYHAAPGLLPLLVASACLCLLFLSHRMGTQLAVLLIPLCAAGWAGNYIVNVTIFFAWLSIALTFSFISTKGRYGLILKDHLKRLFLHFRYGAQSGEGRKFGNPLKLLLWNPLIFFYGMLLFIQKTSFVEELVAGRGLLIAGILFVSIFWVWGSGERHILFAGPFLSLELLRFGVLENWLVALCIVISMLAIDIFYLRFDYGKNLLETELKQSLEVLEKSEGEISLVVPNVSCPALVYLTHKKIFAYPHDAGAMEFNRLYLRRQLADPVFFTKLLQKNPIHHLLVRKPFLVPARIMEMGWQKTFENRKWELYRCLPL